MPTDENVLSEQPHDIPSEAPPPAYPGHQAPGEELAQGGPRHYNTQQRRYIAICAFFVAQARAGGQYLEFWNQCVARYLVEWPLYNAPNMGTFRVRVQADIQHDLELASSSLSCQEVVPFIRWEDMFALSTAQFDEAGAQMLYQQSQIEYENTLHHGTPAVLPPAVPSAPQAPSHLPLPVTTSVPEFTGQSLGQAGGPAQPPSERSQRKGFDLTWIDDDVVDLEAIDLEVVDLEPVTGVGSSL